MQKISIHISKLLFSNSKVVVNGLGYFEAIDKEAYHHPVSHDFTPKTKKITFHLDKNAKDSLLAKTLGSNNADILISAFVKQVIKDLRDGKKAVIPHIGVISIHEKGGIVFIQDKDIAFDNNFFGMEEFHQEPITVAQASPKAIIIPNKEKEKGSNKMWIWIAIVGIVASLIIVYVFLNDDAKLQNDKSEVVITDKLEIKGVKKIEAKEIVANSVENEDIAINTDTVVDIIVETPVVEANVAENGAYYVMAGCFKSSHKAKHYLRELKNGDYPNASINGKTSSGLIRVCYDSFSNETAAEEYMLKVSKKENKDLWMQLIEE
ncbi:MAG: hypothetical protein KAG84_04120 [Bacteroidales bacterium]|nr:hypothetical protein [Bacteroidales bacterium]